MKTSKRPTPLHITTVKDKMQIDLHHNQNVTEPSHSKIVQYRQKIAQNNNRQQSLLATFGQKGNQQQINEKVKRSQNQMKTNANAIKFKHQNNSFNMQKNFTIKMIQVENKSDELVPAGHKLNHNFCSAQKFVHRKQQFLSQNKINKNNQLLSSRNIIQQQPINSSEQISVNVEQNNKQNTKTQRANSLNHKVINNPQNQQNNSTNQLNSKESSPQRSYSNLPINSNVKRYHQIPISQKQKPIEEEPNCQEQLKINFKKKTYEYHTQQNLKPSKNEQWTEKNEQIGGTTESLNNNNIVKTTQENEQEIISLIHQDNNLGEEEEGNRSYKEMFLSKNISIIKSNHQSNDNDNFDFQKNTNDILKLFANLGSNKSDRQMEKLRNKMKHQKNLKLKDYLRLTSLSNDVRFDNYNKSQPQIKQKPTISKSPLLSVDDAPILDKGKTAINPQRSISLIKASLRKKLEDAISTSLELFKLLQQDTGLMGDDYEDLVFMCNFHRVFKENMFKTTDLLEDIFHEYQAKKEINKMIQKKQEITHEEVIELLSPRKRKKKQDENISMLLIEKILMGLNVIKMDDGDNNYTANNSNNCSQVLVKMD